MIHNNAKNNNYKKRYPYSTFYTRKAAQSVLQLEKTERMEIKTGIKCHN